jgi:hypothetical protein
VNAVSGPLPEASPGIAEPWVPAAVAGDCGACLPDRTSISYYFRVGGLTTALSYAVVESSTPATTWASKRRHGAASASVPALILPVIGQSEILDVGPPTRTPTPRSRQGDDVCVFAQRIAIRSPAATIRST